MEAPLVTPEVYSAYTASRETWRNDEFETVQSTARRNGWLAIAGLCCGVVGIGVAAIVNFNAKPTGWIINCNEAHQDCVAMERVDKANLRPYVFDYFLKEYVRMRASYNEPDADAAFGAVVCMSSESEQQRFGHWYNDDKSAPQQKFARTHGYRVASIISGPEIIGDNKGASRIRIDYHVEDVTPGGKSETQTVKATFTVRKGKRTPCNPTGQYIDEYRDDDLSGGAS